MAENMHPHTPGPWILDDFEVSGEISGAAICRVLEADDFPCVEEGTEDDVAAECLANAHLIAAAPDLLIALRGAERIIAREFPNGQGIIDIRAAIAKAEGK